MKKELMQALFETPGEMFEFIKSRLIEKDEIVTITESNNGFRLWYYF